MKRTMALLAGLGVLGAAAYWGGHAVAQQQFGQQPVYAQPVSAPVQPRPAMPQAASRSRVATVNLLYVVKNYTKCQYFESQIKQEYESVSKVFESKNALMQGWKGEMDNPKTPAERREQIEREAKKIQRELQELKEENDQKLGKKRGEMATQLYKEIEDAVRSYARSNDLEMVLHYNEAVTQADVYNPFNVQRKMRADGCVPMYLAPGLDISEAVVGMLNSKFQTSAVPAAGTAVPVAPRGN